VGLDAVWRRVVDVRERGFLAAWRFYRSHFRAVFVLSIVFYAAIVGFAAVSVVELGSLRFVAIVYLVLASIFWLQAPLARLVDDVRERRPDAGIRRTFASVYPCLGSITGGTAVAAVAVLVAAGFFVLPGLIVLGRLALFIPVIVLEGSGAFAAFGRSNRLQHRHEGRVMLELVGSTVGMVVVWSIAYAILTTGKLWISIPVVILFLAVVTPPVPLMRILSYYDLVKAEAREEALPFDGLTMSTHNAAREP
jgi:hypothetical protein